MLKDKQHMQLVYLPGLASLSHLHDRYTLAACIQASNPPQATGSPLDRTYDLFIENRAYMPYGIKLAVKDSSLFQVSLFGSSITDPFSITKFCTAMGFKEDTTVACLRFYNFQRVAGIRFWDLAMLSAIELYDCPQVNYSLPPIARKTQALTRFVLAYSGYPRNGRLPVLTAASGKHIRNILQTNNRMEDLRICVEEITSLTTDQLINSLLATLKRLSVLRSSSDIFKPSDYARIAQKCPALEGIATTMQWIPMIECAKLNKGTKFEIKAMISNFQAISNLRYITIIRLGDVRLYQPLDLPEYLFRVALMQDVTEDSPKTDSAGNDDFYAILSLYYRQREYASTKRRMLGNHFTTTRQGQVKKFTSSNRDVVSTPRFFSASFGRNMSEFAAADGVRYQFGGSNDLERDIGWTPSDVSLVQA